jgi:hypothetical protein
MIPSITIDVSVANAKLGGMPEQVRNNLRRTLPNLAKRLGAAVETNMGVLQSHNRLKVTKQLVENPQTIYARVALVWTGEQSKALVPTYLEEGTRPHVIEARNARVLAFYWPKIGGWFFGPKVNHPGNKAYRIFGDAYDAQKGDIRLQIELAVKAAARGLPS